MPEKEQQQQEAYQLQPVTLFQNIRAMPSLTDDVVKMPAVFTTYEISDPAIRGEVYDLMTQGGQPADGFIGKEFGIKHVTVFTVSFTDKETGEVIVAPLILLTTADGDVIQFVSKGIWGSLIMMRACGYAPFGPEPQKFKLVQIAIGDKKRFYQLHRVKQEAKKK